MAGVLSIGVVEGLIRFKDESSAALSRFADNLEQSGTKIQRIGQNLTSLGTTLTTRITAPLVSLGGVAVTAATQFDSSFTGVKKTVNATDEELAELAATLRNMAAGEDPIPINVNELNAIAEAAGQLGIETHNIANFTRTMAQLGVTTNLTADQAVTSLARLANITQMPQEDFDRLGSTVVDLGNNFATTEAEIVEMGLRLAGAGNIVGLTEPQILSMATALSSVGINAEAGGSSVSKVMLDIKTAVDAGGNAVKLFADVSGVSISEFEKLFKENAAGAIDLFISGLGRMREQGGPVTQTLDEMGFSSIRVRASLLGLAGAGDLLTRTLSTGTSAWEENIALAKEAELRFSTFESQLTVFWNRLKDVVITFGTALLPLLVTLLDLMTPVISVVESAAHWFANLSTPLQALIVGFGALIAAIGPVVFIVGNLVTAAGALGITFSSVVAALPTAAFIAFGAAVGALLLFFKPVRDFLTSLASVTFQLLRRAVISVIATLRQWWNETERARRFLMNLGRVIAGEIHRAFLGFVRNLRSAYDFAIDLADAIRIMWEESDIFRPILEGVVEVLGNFVEMIIAGWRALGQLAIELFNMLGGWDRLLHVVGLISPQLRSMIDKILEWIGRANELTDANNLVAESVERFDESIGDSIVNATAFESINEQIREELGLVDTGLGTVDSALNTFKSTVTGTEAEISKLKTSIGELKTEIAGAKIEIEGIDFVLDSASLSTEEWTAAADSLVDTMNETIDVSDTMVLASGAIESGNKAVAESTKESEEQFKSWGEQATSAIFSIIDGTRSLGDVLRQLLVDLARRWMGQFVETMVSGFSAAFSSGRSESVAAGADIAGAGVKAAGGWKNALGSIDWAGWAGIAAAAGFIAFFAHRKAAKSYEERLASLFGKMADGTFTTKEYDAAMRLLLDGFIAAADGTRALGEAQRGANLWFSAFVDIARVMGSRGVSDIRTLVVAMEQAGANMTVVHEKLREVTQEMGDAIAERAAFMVDQASIIGTALTEFIGDVSIATAADVEFAAESIVQAFNTMVDAGAPLDQIAAELGPLFEDLQSRGRELGLVFGEEFSRMGEVMTLLADEKLQRPINKLEEMAQVVQSVGNLGLLTADQFDAFGLRISNTFGALTNGGLEGREALAQIAPQLQLLQDLSQQYGLTISENNQALIDEASALGLVTDKALTAESIMIEGFNHVIEALNRLIVALGGIPVAFDGIGLAGKDLEDKLRDNFGGVGGSGDDAAGDLEVAFDQSFAGISNSASSMGEHWNGVVGGMIDDQETFINTVNASSVSSADVVSTAWTGMGNEVGDVLQSLGVVSEVVFDNVKDAAVDNAATATNSWHDAIRDIWRNYNAMVDRLPDIPVASSGGGGGPPVPSFSMGSGSFRNFGSTGTLAELHNVEQVVTLREGQSIVDAVSGIVSSVNNVTGDNELVRRVAQLVQVDVASGKSRDKKLDRLEVLLTALVSEIRELRKDPQFDLLGAGG